MDLCIKTMMTYIIKSYSPVSILVLMDLCIKTVRELDTGFYEVGFNPCFNGSMYKNHSDTHIYCLTIIRFNPCFNGSMYKNNKILLRTMMEIYVSILVLMDLCIKTNRKLEDREDKRPFQSLF